MKMPVGQNAPALTIVVPVFNECECIRTYVEAVAAQTMPCEWKLLFVDDGSTDGTLAAIKEIASSDRRVHYISFPRNFGKEAALLAGLEHSGGDLVATMDVDMQDPPSLLPEMARAIREEKFDVVATRRTTRKGEPLLRSLFAHLFYKTMRCFSDLELVEGARDYRMMTRKVVDAVVSMQERDRFIKGIFPWVGFKTKWIDYEYVPRTTGSTKWSFWKLFVYGVNGVLSFSTAPLRSVAFGGILAFAAAFPLLVFMLVRHFALGRPFTECAVLAYLIAFLASMQTLAVGIFGLYLAKIHRESTRRPHFVIAEQA